MLLSGKEIALALHEEYKAQIATFERAPKLAVVLVGNDPASIAYIGMKEKACAKVGIESPLYTYPDSMSESELLELISTLNHDSGVDAILVQLPLPSQINEQRVMEAIDPKKDVDGFHPVNMGKLLLGQKDGLIPCTPLGVQVLLERANIDVAGKHVVIVGRSNIVGKPLAALLMQKQTGANATVTVAHSRTSDLAELTRSADILVAAMGVAHFIKGDMVNEGAVVIDVGISRENGKLVGDVDFGAVESKCRAITPVPGGVGPMTVAMLLHNTIKCFRCV